MVPGYTSSAECGSSTDPALGGADPAESGGTGQVEAGVDPRLPAAGGGPPSDGGARSSSSGPGCESVGPNGELDAADDCGACDRPSAVVTPPDTPVHQAESDAARSAPDPAAAGPLSAVPPSDWDQQLGRHPSPTRDGLRLPGLDGGTGRSRRLLDGSGALPTSPGSELDGSVSLGRRPRFVIRPTLSKQQLKYALDKTDSRPGEPRRQGRLNLAESRDHTETGVTNREPCRDIFCLLFVHTAYVFQFSCHRPLVIRLLVCLIVPCGVSASEGVTCAAPAEGSRLAPPDGRWAWVVLAGSMVINVLIPGFIKSFGVLFDDVCEQFDASPAAVSWIPALSFFMYNFMGEWPPGES